MPELLDLGRMSETAPETVSVEHAWSLFADLLAFAQTSDQLTEARWRERRHQVVREGRKLASDHRELYASRLAAMTANNTRRSVLDLLGELSDQHGVAWSDIAAMLGVSVPALRKWRKTSSGTTPENHQKLARLVAFFSVLGESVASPARWMSMPPVDGYNVAPENLYSDDAAPALLDLAAGNAGVSPEALLDELEPGWRETWLSRYEVFEAEDGEMSMRPRTA
jgi:hypothetical protein